MVFVGTCDPVSLRQPSLPPGIVSPGIAIGRKPTSNCERRSAIQTAKPNIASDTFSHSGGVRDYSSYRSYLVVRIRGLPLGAGARLLRRRRHQPHSPHRPDPSIAAGNLTETAPSPSWKGACPFIAGGVPLTLAARLAFVCEGRSLSGLAAGYIQLACSPRHLLRIIRGSVAA